jgi:hypothetical protein
LSSLIENLLNDGEMLKAKSAESLMYWNTICEQNLAVRIARFIEPIENKEGAQVDPHYFPDTIAGRTLHRKRGALSRTRQENEQ